MPVSVVIPLYNKAASIGRAIGSVLSQTMPDIELIVVDDGSSDDGASIAAAIRDERIRVVRQENSGVSAARNRGVAEARHGLVAFLDADDIWEPRFLEASVSARVRYPEAVAWFADYYNTSPSRSVPAMGATGRVVVIHDYAAWFIRHRGQGLFSSSSLIRKDALVACGGFPEGIRNGEDTDTWFRLSWQGPVVYIGEALAHYFEGVESGLSATTGPTYPCLCSTIDARLESTAVPPDMRRSLKAAKRWLIQCYAANLALAGKRREALRSLSKVLPTPRTLRMWARAVFAIALGR